MNILDKYAVVTGASSGIGWYISKELAARGYSIVAVSNQSENLTKLKSELQETYGNHDETGRCGKGWGECTIQRKSRKGSWLN